MPEDVELDRIPIKCFWGQLESLGRLKLARFVASQFVNHFGMTSKQLSCLKVLKGKSRQAQNM